MSTTIHEIRNATSLTPVRVRVPENCHSSIRSAGGKSVLVPNLAALTPPNAHEFREPFASSAAMTFFMIRHRRTERFWINDVDPAVSNYHEVVQNQCTAMTALLLVMFETYGRCSANLFEHACQMVLSDDRVEAAAGFFVRNRLARSGTNGMSGYNVSYEDYEGRGLNRVHINRLWQFSEWLKGVRITNLDYREVMDAPGEGVMIFLDPPYHEVGKTMYPFGSADLADLSQHVRTSPHSCLVTVDDSPTNRVLFSDMHPTVRTYTSTMGNHHEARELICANYTTPLYEIHASNIGMMLEPPPEKLPGNENEVVVPVDQKPTIIETAKPKRKAVRSPAKELSHAQKMFMREGGKTKCCEWYTPESLLRHLYAANGNQAFDLDPCSPCSGENAPVWARQHFTIIEDGLKQEWHGRVWLNPPYSGLAPWVQKAADAVWCRHMPNAPTQASALRDKPLCETVVGIIPARTQRKFWRDFVSEHARVFFVTGAFGFLKGDGGKGIPIKSKLPEGIALVVWGNHTPFTDCLRKLPASQLNIYERSAPVTPDIPVQYWNALKEAA